MTEKEKELIYKEFKEMVEFDLKRTKFLKGVNIRFELYPLEDQEFDKENLTFYPSFIFEVNENLKLSEDLVLGNVTFKKGEEIRIERTVDTNNIAVFSEETLKINRNHMSLIFKDWTICVYGKDKDIWVASEILQRELSEKDQEKYFDTSIKVYRIFKEMEYYFTKPEFLGSIEGFRD